MSAQTSIEWTDRTWTRGCTRVSEGCRNCYAERMASRGFSWSKGFATATPSGPRWTGKVALIPEALEEPLHWRKPQRIFVNSMSDLFHESLPFEDIAKVIERMAWGDFLNCRKGKECQCSCAHDADQYDPEYERCHCWTEIPRHTYQVLTKRPKRMLEFFNWLGSEEAWHHARTWNEFGPPENVWLGVSVEDQATADERIPLLLQTPSAVRFVSYEPALAAVNFGSWIAPKTRFPVPMVSWVIVGGESGPGARPFDLAWARSAVQQCKAAGVPVFVKQLGRVPFDSRPGPWGDEARRLKDRKGGDMAEWPEDLRVREFPS